MKAHMTKLAKGQHFEYEGIDWICLDILDGKYLLITSEPIKDEIPFDIEGTNNWKDSSLRRVLNCDFLDRFDRSALALQTIDLIADNGDTSYGVSEDYVSILSCDQYRKYREILLNHYKWTWTLTPVECAAHTTNLQSLRVIGDRDTLYYYNSSSPLEVAPLILLKG